MILPGKLSLIDSDYNWSNWRKFVPCPYTLNQIPIPSTYTGLVIPTPNSTDKRPPDIILLNPKVPRNPSIKVFRLELYGLSLNTPSSFNLSILRGQLSSSPSEARRTRLYPHKSLPENNGRSVQVTGPRAADRYFSLSISTDDRADSSI